MKSVHLPIPAEIKKLCDTLRKSSFEAYLVGGCVRDLLLSREPKDWDITTNAKPEEIQKLFAETFYENKFGTVGVLTGSEDPRLKVVEITPYRIEGKYSDARRPDEVLFSDKLEDDLERRDFTINAVAYEPATGTLVDLHGGQEDIKRRLISAVGKPDERFKEDALRMLRAVRLSAELEFAIETNTAKSISEDAALLKKISRERVRDEFVRIIESEHPMQALFVAQKLKLFAHIVPELEEGIDCEQNQAHAYDVFEHSLRALQHAADRGWSLEIRLAALLHDVGKPSARRWSDEKKDWTFHGHEVIGARIAKKIMTDLRMPTHMIETVVSLIRWHMFFSDPEKITLSAVRRTIRNVGREHIKDLLSLRICDRIGTGRPKEQPFRLRKYMSMVDEAMRDPISVSMLAINGARLIEMGETPGPRFGWILHALLEEVIDNPKRNTKEYLENRTRELSRLPEHELKKLGEAGKDRKVEEEETAVEELRKKHHVS
ncbi:hypothetical protein A3A39_00675 [Candidatus Kaiserbacteria bacterium RIFCSPLOWO2_01_FULL_54_13]|uniref:HD domain-containing protein n=1 Tax=Candidatus Kaiserbacteria bacterium RIFCSPLOWO2_01_FULL_54_13 TaxID=1798512 RepID=A0A1F6EZX6_9BACT|nr:MAG: hypothetical protein A3A39_00675 [Candidatus Kaiserbacteria bacterium RIFCSPLOWO2_01_FULL_54_13]